MKSLFHRMMSLTLATALLLVLLPAAASAEPADIAAINQPATVLVVTKWKADLKLQAFNIDTKKMVDDAGEEVLAKINRGELSSDESVIKKELFAATWRLMGSDLEKYAVLTGQEQTLPVLTALTGSGFIVTPEGHVVTNAHNVQPGEKDVFDALVKIALDEAGAATNWSELDTSMTEAGYTVSQKEKDDYLKAYLALISKNITVENLQTTYACVLGNTPVGSNLTVTGSGDDVTDIRGTEMELVETGEPYPGKDIAILKIQGQTNLPTVALGDDAALNQGDAVYAMGYSGEKTKQEYLYENSKILQSLQEPELASGTLSAKKQMSGGWDAFQMDAFVDYGISGGPLFDASGKVVGVNTVGTPDESTGELAPNAGYAISIGVVKQFLSDNNITPTESAFTTDFRKGLEAYNKGKYNKAVTLLQGVNDTSPGYPSVQKQLSEAQIQLVAHPGLFGLDISPWMIIAGVVILLVLAVVVILIIVMRGKKKKAYANESRGMNPNSPTPNVYMNTNPTPTGMYANTNPSPGMYANTNPPPGMYANTNPPPGMYANTNPPPGMYANTNPPPGMYANTGPTSVTPGSYDQTVAGYGQAMGGRSMTPNPQSMTPPPQPMTANTSASTPCPRCGALMPPEMQFCSRCGAPIDRADNPIDPDKTMALNNSSR